LVVGCGVGSGVGLGFGGCVGNGASVGYCVGFLAVGNIVGGRTGEYFPLLTLLAYAASL